MTKHLLFATCLAACTTEATSSDSQPLAEVTLESGAVVSFYETSPGAIAISEDYALGEAPVATIGRTAVDVFTTIAPGRAVPEALVAAQARNIEARASRPHAPLPPPRSSYIDNTTIDDKWFVDTYCGGSWDSIWCWINKTTEIGNSTPTKNWNTDEFYETGCADRGQIRMWANVDDVGHGWTIVEGHCRYYHWTSGWLNVFSAGGVTDLVDNARYHFSDRIRY